jgi:hypothetical protein
MAIDYDAKDTVAESLMQLSSYEGAVDSALYDNFHLPLNIRMADTKSQGWYLTSSWRRSSELPDYYVGTLQTYLSQTTAAVEVCRLWVEYDVSLITPQQDHDNEAAHFSFDTSVAITVAHDYVSDYLISATPVRQGTAWTATSNHLYCSRAGTYLVQAAIGATGTLSAATITESGDATAVVAQANTWSADDKLVTGAWIVTATVGQYFDLVIGTSGFTSTSGDIRFTKYDALFD